MAQKVQVLIIYKGLAENAPYFYIISNESKMTLDSLKSNKYFMKIVIYYFYGQERIISLR